MPTSTNPNAVTDWPKTFILEVHRQAVEHGLIFLEPISEADATSFRQRFYRTRRRSDKAMAAFIPPEFHLVMVGAWIAEGDGLGKLPIIYNQRADGKPLPGIRAATEAEALLASDDPAARRARVPAPHLAEEPLLAPTRINMDELEAAMTPAEIDDFVARMQRTVAERDEGEEE